MDGTLGCTASLCMQRSHETFFGHRLWDAMWNHFPGEFLVKRQETRLAATMLTFCLGIASCARPSSLPTVPADARMIEPPAVYQLWWKMTEECSGRTGELNQIAWYIVPGATQLTLDTHEVDGYWTARGNSIVLADSVRLDGALVRHEMLHALIGTASAQHSREMFMERCGGIVACDERCVADAGTPPPIDSSSLMVPPESVLVDTKVVPESPSRSQFGGNFALIVSARNASDQPIVVTLPRVGAKGGLIGFGYHLTAGSLYLSTDEVESDPGVERFEPGAVKSYAFDLTIGEAREGAGIPTGPLKIVGSFGGHDSATPRLYTITS